MKITEWQIARLEVPNGESEVVNFLKREFEPKGLDPIWFDEYFSWKVGPLNPGGKGYLFVVYASGKVLACLSLAVKKALFNGQEIKTAEFGDAYCSNLFFENIKYYKPAALHPDFSDNPNAYVNKSPFGRIAYEATKAAISDGIHFLYGTPNNNAFPGWINRLGHFHLTSHNVYVFFRPTIYHLSKRISMPSALRRKLFFLDWAFNYLLRISYSDIFGKKIRISENIPSVEELNELWNKTRINKGYTLIRNGNYWMHRYFRHPLKKYLTYSIYKAGEFAGLVVFCIENEDGSKKARLMEWMLHPSLKSAYIFAHVIQKVMRGRIDYCITYCDETDKDALALRNNLFSRHNKIIITFYKNNFCNPESMINMIQNFYMGNTDAA